MKASHGSSVDRAVHHYEVRVSLLQCVAVQSRCRGGLHTGGSACCGASPLVQSRCRGGLHTGGEACCGASPLVQSRCRGGLHTGGEACVLLKFLTCREPVEIWTRSLYTFNYDMC